MRNHNHSFLRDVVAILASALSTAAAVDRGARPSDSELRKLGIDPAGFPNIRRYY